MTGNEKDYTAVLLEDVNSNMKAFWGSAIWHPRGCKRFKSGNV